MEKKHQPNSRDQWKTNEKVNLEYNRKYHTVLLWPELLRKSLNCNAQVDSIVDLFTKFIRIHYTYTNVLESLSLHAQYCS